MLFEAQAASRRSDATLHSMPLPQSLREPCLTASKGYSHQYTYAAKCDDDRELQGLRVSMIEVEYEVGVVVEHEP